MYPGQRNSDTSAPALSVDALRINARSPSEWRLGLTDLDQTPWATFSRYAVAILSVSAALFASKVAVDYLDIEPYVSMFLCAIMFAAWFGGLGPGLLSTVLAGLAFEYFVASPTNSFAIDPHQIPRVGLFLITALFVNWIAAAQRRATRSLDVSRRDLLTALEQQKRTEARLLRSEMYLAEAQRLSRTGSFGWKVANGEISWSEETFRIFECDPAMTPTLEFVFQRIHPEDRAFVRRTIDRASEDGVDFDHEARLVMPGGAVKHIRALAHTVKGSPDGIEFIGAVTDVTATKQAEAALNDAQADLAHATRVITLGELTSSIAHEVNQPLAAIMSNGEACLRWLDRGAPGMEHARRSVEWIVKDVSRAADVIGRVRALARKTDSERALLDVNDVVNEARVLMRRELSSKHITLRTELTADPLIVRADRVQLQQVVINLVMNGIEAMQPVTDRPRELLIRSQRSFDAEQAILTTADCGVGFSDENAERLFNAFFTTKSSGLGLGLSICRSIVEAHGGKLSACRNAGPGATFQFTLPLHEDVRRAQ
jgi:C4-dicarboxylate-specific signal transduction histidine kinase